MSRVAPARIRVRAADGHMFEAWRCDPLGAPRAGVIVLHAVYGLTDHMRDVCAGWAAAGYAAVAPALYDRIGPARTHAYDRAGADAGIADYASLAGADILRDVEACRAALGDAPCVISGFCTGGSWAWRAAAAAPFAAQVNYYGSHLPQLLDLAPGCPTLVHYGDRDPVVPLDAVRRVRAARPEIELLVHEGAGHAFFNPDQPTYDAGAAQRAHAASLAFLARVLPR
ncbi:MAG TPA: dienelactone hydrolase family protein [Beijerinckiaceae bacterium]